MKKITKLVAGAALIVAAAATYPAQAHADDSWHVVAQQVCDVIQASPTIDTIDAVVMALYAAGNDETTENAVMSLAMNSTCPQYKYLAVQASERAIHNKLQQTWDDQHGDIPGGNPYAGSDESAPFNGKRMI